MLGSVLENCRTRAQWAAENGMGDDGVSRRSGAEEKGDNRGLAPREQMARDLQTSILIVVN